MYALLTTQGSSQDPRNNSRTSHKSFTNSFLPRSLFFYFQTATHTHLRFQFRHSSDHLRSSRSCLDISKGWKRTVQDDVLSANAFSSAWYEKWGTRDNLRKSWMKGFPETMTEKDHTSVKWPKVLLSHLNERIRNRRRREEHTPRERRQLNCLCVTTGGPRLFLLSHLVSSIMKFRERRN